MRRDVIKTVFLIVAVLGAVYCTRRADHFDAQADNLSQQITKIRSTYVGDAASNAADKIVQPLEKDRDDLRAKSQELNHLFTYVISGFLGLAISVAADLLGQANANPPPPAKPQESR
jgi:hypothetical protein